LIGIHYQKQCIQIETINITITNTKFSIQCTVEDMLVVEYAVIVVVSIVEELWTFWILLLKTSAMKMFS